MVRLFQTELEHYEKIRSHRLCLEGKANYLARMVRNQLPMAFQGLVVVPLFAGYDEEQETGRSSPTTWSAAATRSRTSGHRLGGQGGKAFLRGFYRPDLVRGRSARYGDGGAGGGSRGGHRHRRA